jgi:hypothetical protein
MKKFVFLSVAFFHLLAGKNSSAQVSTSIDDFTILTGSWSGSLAYLDYSSDNLITLPAELEVVKDEKLNQLIFYISFPEEPQANNIDTLIISADGTLLEEEPVVSKKSFDDGSLEIITEITGTDGNEDKPALIRHTYIIGQNKFVLRKIVRYIDEEEWILRNEFSLIRNTESN